MRHHETHPRSLFPPGVQDPYLQYAVRLFSAYRFIDLPKLLADLSHPVHKSRELGSQRQIPAVTDSLQRLPHQRPTRRSPIPIQFLQRRFFVPFIERIREKVGQQPSLTVLHVRDLRQHSHRHSSAHASYHRVQFHFLKVFPVRLRPDPRIPQKHHRFLPACVHNLH